MDFILVSAGMEFPSSGKVRAGGHSGRAFSLLGEEGVPARLPSLSEPGARREQREPPEFRSAPVLLLPAVLSSAPSSELLRTRESGRYRGPGCPGGSGSARGSPSGPGPPVSRGLRVTARGIACRSELQPGRQRGPGAPSAGERRGTERPGRRQRGRLVPPRPGPRGETALWGFSGLSLGTASAGVCARSSSASCCREVLPLHPRNGASCSWSRSGKCLCIFHGTVPCTGFLFICRAFSCFGGSVGFEGYFLLLTRS